LHAVAKLARRKNLLKTIIVAIIAVGLLAGFVVSPFIAVGAPVVVALYVFDFRRSVKKFTQSGNSLGNVLLDAFKAGGTPKDRQRLVTVLDRLAATFGVDSVSAFIVEDEGYNATLVPNGSGYALFITSALMRDFELIELEGVVAHCLARQRLALLQRQSVASLASLSAEDRKSLAGSGAAYRADEVAAAAIRYPLGLAGALRKCSRQVVPAGSFFLTPNYDQGRWVWFDIWSDRKDSNLSDLDDVELRALALEEW
jgi:Zn-dependent protease with chaperone function